MENIDQFEEMEESQVDAVQSDVHEEEASKDDEISFADLGLDAITLDAITKKGFVKPSPIQVLAIPRLLNGEANVIAKARTGTGKTAAFGLPIVQDLREESDHVRAIILEPTRELAQQTATEMASFTATKFPRTAVVYGGASMGEQIRSLRRGVEIVVGTPGRVQDLIERGVLSIDKIDYFILDEADEMLDMGFIDDIENIFADANPDSRVLLFSATMPAPILKIAQKFMGDYEIVEEENHEEAPLLIEQKYWVVRESEKIEALVRLIDISPDFYGLVFVQRKSDADYVSKTLDEKGYEAAALHGDIPQGQREKILARFRSKKTRVLVATDVAARGIDIEGLTHVVNYELPFDGPTYVHRIGRTGRAGSSGLAVTFVKPEETRRKLQFLINAVRKSAKGEISEGEIPQVEQVLSVKKDRLFDNIKDKLGYNDFDEPENKDDNDDELIPFSGEVSASEDEETVSEKKTPKLRMGDPVFAKLAQELCEGQNPEDVVTSLLAVVYGNELSRSRYGKISAVKSKSDRSRDRGDRGDRGSRGSRGGDRFVSEDQMRIYARMGWNDRYNPRKVADFLHSLIGIPGRKVDAIDMADDFCLFTVPADDGRRLIEMSERDRSLPHMHQDAKVSEEAFESRGSFSDRGSRGGRRDDRRRDDDRRGRDRGFGRDRDRERSSKRDFGDRKAKGGSNARKGVHTSTQRSGSASFFKKGSSVTEY